MRGIASNVISMQQALLRDQQSAKADANTSASKPLQQTNEYVPIKHTLHDYLLEHEPLTYLQERELGIHKDHDKGLFGNVQSESDAKTFFSFQPEFNAHKHIKQLVKVERSPEYKYPEYSILASAPVATNVLEIDDSELTAQEAAGKYFVLMQQQQEQKLVQLEKFQEKVKSRLKQKYDKDKQEKLERIRLIQEGALEPEADMNDFEQQRVRKMRVQEYSQKVNFVNKKKSKEYREQQLEKQRKLEEEERIRNIPPPKPETPPPPPIHVHRANIINNNKEATHSFYNDNSTSSSPNVFVQRKLANNQSVPFYIAKRTSPNQKGNQATSQSRPKSASAISRHQPDDESSPRSARQSMLKHAVGKKTTELGGNGTMSTEQHTAMSSRMIDAMKDKLIQKVKEHNLCIPPLCNCYRDWQQLSQAGASCCNNCIYYRNTRLFVEHLAQLLRSMDIPL